MELFHFQGLSFHRTTAKSAMTAAPTSIRVIVKRSPAGIEPAIPAVEVFEFTIQISKQSTIRKAETRIIP